MKFLFLLFLFQEVSTSKENTLKFSYEKPENLKSKVLWVSTDKGKTWLKSDSVLKHVRFVVQEKHIYVYFEAMEDGQFGFYLQLEDTAGNKVPEPVSGTLPQVSVLVDTEQPKIEYVRKETIFSNNLKTGIVFNVHETGGIMDKTLWFSKDNKVWFKSTDSKEVSVQWMMSGNQIIADTTVESDGKYWFCVQLADIAGNKTPDPMTQGASIIEVEFSVQLPQIVLPSRNETLSVPGVYVVKWYSPVSLGLVDRSAVLSYRKNEGEWVKIAGDLDLNGIYLWSPPIEDAKVDLKLEVVSMMGNSIASPIIRSIRLKNEKSSNIKHAVELYKAARIHLAQKDYEVALAKYYMTLDEWSSYPEALNDVANIFYEKGEKERSLEYFYKALNADKGNAKCYLNISICLFDLRMYDKALEPLRSAILLSKEEDSSVPTKSAILLIKLNEVIKDEGLRKLYIESIDDALKLKIAGSDLIQKLSEIKKAGSS